MIFTWAELATHLALYLVKCLDLVFEDLADAVRVLLFVFPMILYCYRMQWPARATHASNGLTRLWCLELTLIGCLASPSPCLWYEVLYLWLAMVHRSAEHSNVNCHPNGNEQFCASSAHYLPTNSEWLCHLQRFPVKCKPYARAHIWVRMLCYFHSNYWAMFRYCYLLRCSAEFSIFKK